jgi:hypothetical protein
MFRRAKSWLPVASLWLIGAAVVLGADGWRWT